MSKRKSERISKIQEILRDTVQRNLNIGGERPNPAKPAEYALVVCIALANAPACHAGCPSGRSRDTFHG